MKSITATGSILFVISTLISLISPTNAFAIDIISFPVCSNPQGELKVSYAEGNHAIVGDRNTHQGSDNVYDLGKGNFMQCYCSDDGSGIQTNWLKIADIADKEIDSYVKLGWIFVPDGAVWGLNGGAYLAKNSTLSCGSIQSTPTPTSIPSTSSGVGGVITETAASTSSDPAPVLGLANSGTAKEIAYFTIVGLACITIGKKIKAY